jgi:hypothetical protein
MAGWRSPCKSVISQSWRPTFPGWREVRRQRESDSISEILCWTRKSVSAWDALMNSNKTPSNNHTKIIGESVVRAGNFELPPHSRAKSQYPPRPLPTVADYSLLSGFLPRPRATAGWPLVSSRSTWIRSDEVSDFINRAPAVFGVLPDFLHSSFNHSVSAERPSSSVSAFGLRRFTLISYGRPTRCFPLPVSSPLTCARSPAPPVGS